MKDVFMDGVLLYFHIKYNGDWDDIYNALDTKELTDIDLLMKYQKEYKGKYWTCLDKDYPGNVYGPKPPFVIMKEDK